MNGNDLEAVAGIFPARIGDGEDPDPLVASADVGNRDTELFQAAFERFDSKILIV